jgi:hypothetical protein
MNNRYPPARAHRQAVATDDDDRLYDTRMPSSVRRYPAGQRRVNYNYAGTITQEEMYRRTGMGLVPVQRSQPLPRRQFHWLVYAGLLLIVMLLGWVVLSFVTGWWQTWQDDLHFGRPRTYQTDAVVGHNDSPTTPSHFLAINLNRHVEIIECPGGDCTRAKIYVGPVLIGQGQDLAPVTLTFKDVNGDGNVDMIVQVADGRVVFINEHGQFRPQRPDERINL